MAVEVDLGPGGLARLRRLAIDPPLTAKRRPTARAGEVELWVVSSAASLLEGDRLRVELSVAAGATLVVRTVAAQLVHPCPDGRWAEFELQAVVDGTLVWLPEPVIVAATARFRSSVEVVLGAGARGLLREELVLGRSNEDPTACVVDSSVRCDNVDRPLLRDGLVIAQGWHGPATAEPSTRYIGSLHGLGVEELQGYAGVGVNAGCWQFVLAGPGRTRRVLAKDASLGRQLLVGQPP